MTDAADRLARCDSLSRRALLLAGAILAATAVPALAAAQSRPVPIQRAELAAIDWASAEADRGAHSGADFLPPVNASLSELDRVGLPVLLPTGFTDASARPEGGRGCFLFLRATTYTASFYLADAQIEVSGSRQVTAALNSGGRGDRNGYRLTDTRFGQTLGFSRYGASYQVAVTCSDPEAGGLCRNPNFIRRIADSLRVAGGAPAAS